MKNIEHFARELDLIKDEDLKMVVKGYMECAVPDYFWTIGASSSGKYHPEFAQGEGGLIRHTKAVVMFAEELLRMSSYAYMNEAYKDYVIAACIVHDTVKYGFNAVMDKAAYKNHGADAAINFKAWCNTQHYEVSTYLLDAIRCHMGQWSTNKEDRPFTQIDRCVHMADYMASRSFIDIPEIRYDYAEVARAEG